MTKLKLDLLPLCVGVVGSRSFSEKPVSNSRMEKMVRSFVYSLDERTEIVSGGAKGVDAYAENAARLRGMRVTVFEPDPSIRIPERFFARNRELARHVSRCDGVIVAFIDESDWDGTRYTIEFAQSILVPTLVLPFSYLGKWNGEIRGNKKYVEDS